MITIEFPTFGFLAPGGGNFCIWGALDPATDIVISATATYVDANGDDVTSPGTEIGGFPADTYGFSFSLTGAFAPGPNEEIRVEVQGAASAPIQQVPVVPQAPIPLTPGVTIKVAPRVNPPAPAGPVPPGP